MSVIYGILLAIIQGITEFLPVSSFGHLVAAEKLMGMERSTGLLFETMLHLGTAAAIIFLFRRDLYRITEELLGMIMDIIGNINLYIHNRKTGESLGYARIVHGTYRKFTALLVVSMIPTVLIGFTARRLAGMAAASPILPGIGFLLSGIFLLVTDLNNSGGDKGPRDAGYDSAMWIGICQGLGVFPGVSRMALTICAALLCGYSCKFAVKFSILMSLPAIIGAFFSQLGQFGAPDMSIGLGFTYVFCTLVAGVVSVLVIRTMHTLVLKKKFRIFAYYSFLAGVITLAVNYL